MEHHKTRDILEARIARSTQPVDQKSAHSALILTITHLCAVSLPKKFRENFQLYLKRNIDSLQKNLLFILTFFLIQFHLKGIHILCIYLSLSLYHHSLCPPLNSVFFLQMIPLRVSECNKLNITVGG